MICLPSMLYPWNLRFFAQPPKGDVPASIRSECTQERFGETRVPWFFRASGRGSGGLRSRGPRRRAHRNHGEGPGTARVRRKYDAARQYIPREKMCPLSASDPERSSLCRRPLVSSHLSRRGQKSAATRPGSRCQLRLCAGGLPRLAGAWTKPVINSFYIDTECTRPCLAKLICVSDYAV